MFNNAGAFITTSWSLDGDEQQLALSYILII
jgi:hypothetical protein